MPAVLVRNRRMKKSVEEKVARICFVSIWFVLFVFVVVLCVVLSIIYCLILYL